MPIASQDASSQATCRLAAARGTLARKGWTKARKGGSWIMTTCSAPEITKESLPATSQGSDGHAIAGIGGFLGARKSSHHNSGSRRSAASPATERTSSWAWPVPGL